ncbi:MAG TPA: hypothetical protein VK712_03660 [Verrucomicrobiae bacterium]|jgi:hypothetical protein|nr:hypothetical protein [Verrucomicrobiae bacterium]
MMKTSGKAAVDFAVSMKVFLQLSSTPKVILIFAKSKHKAKQSAARLAKGYLDVSVEYMVWLATICPATSAIIDFASHGS